MTPAEQAAFDAGQKSKGLDINKLRSSLLDVAIHYDFMGEKSMVTTSLLNAVCAAVLPLPHILWKEDLIKQMAAIEFGDWLPRHAQPMSINRNWKLNSDGKEYTIEEVYLIFLNKK